MKKYRKTIYLTIALILLLTLLIFNQKAGQGVQRGLILSFRGVLPALFPAMVLSGLIGELAESLPLPPTWTVWIASHLCGFPLGIRTLTLAYERGILEREQAIRLSACCANASPAFLIGLVGDVVMKNQRVGILLFLGQLTISALLFLSGGLYKTLKQSASEDRPLLPILTKSVAEAAQGSLILCAYITLFSVIATLLEGIPYFSYLYGFLEISGGILALPPGPVHLLLVAIMVGFSGVSVFFQNASYLSDAGLPILPMLAGKILYGIFLPIFVIL